MSKRTLVREVLYSQLAFAGLVGVIALGCVWWVSNWVVRDNLDDWAVRWVGEMESLGAGLYVDRSDRGFLDLQHYLKRFPEIEYVRYYDLDGQVIYLDSVREEPQTYPGLETADLKHLGSIAAQDVNYSMDLVLEPLVRICQAVSQESIVSADLFNAQSLDELETQATIVGFVELGLDYSAYDRDLMTGMVTGSVFIVLAFLCLLLHRLQINFLQRKP